jgi:hypothetical protein
MRHGDLMKDPFYAGILFAIESKIMKATGWLLHRA